MMIYYRKTERKMPAITRSQTLKIKQQTVDSYEPHECGVFGGIIRGMEGCGELFDMYDTNMLLLKKEMINIIIANLGSVLLIYILEILLIGVRRGVMDVGDLI